MSGAWPFDGRLEPIDRAGRKEKSRKAVDANLSELWELQGEDGRVSSRRKSARDFGSECARSGVVLRSLEGINQERNSSPQSVASDLQLFLGHLA